MQKLSRLSKECLSHNGLCCENRLNLILEEKEKSINFKDKLIVKKCSFFKKPLCTIYKHRPLDCKVYPITLDLRGKEVVFLIDLKCPAVKKGLINKKFINHAKRLWKANWPSKSWLIQNTKDNLNKKMYKWITLEEYEAYNEKLKRRR